MHFMCTYFCFCFSIVTLWLWTKDYLKKNLTEASKKKMNYKLSNIISHIRRHNTCIHLTRSVCTRWIIPLWNLSLEFILLAIYGMCLFIMNLSVFKGSYNLYSIMFSHFSLYTFHTVALFYPGKKMLIIHKIISSIIITKRLLSDTRVHYCIRQICKIFNIHIWEMCKKQILRQMNWGKIISNWEIISNRFTWANSFFLFAFKLIS